MFKNLLKNKKSSYTMGYSMPIYMNNHIDLVHRAASICVAKKTLEDTNEKLAHIERVMNYGHESVLEHTNLVMMLFLNGDDRIMDFLNIVENMKYLNFKIKKVKDQHIVLIGGSIRGYKHIFRTCKDIINPVIKYIKNELYTMSNSEYFNDFIEAGIMEYNKFKRLDPVGENDEGEYVDERDKPLFECGEDHGTFIIHNIDNIKYVYDKVKEFGFTYDDLLDICTITVEFKNISRAIANQLVRHRAGISQESQRYVDYSNMKFIDPCQFKDKYDSGKLYNINFKDGVHPLYTHQFTSCQLAKCLMDVYPQLREQGMDKEDARSFNLLNVETKLIMTFTLRGLFRFFELRSKPSAQAEVRNTSIKLENVLIDSELYKLIGSFEKYLLPKYQLQEMEYSFIGIDEALGDLEDSSTTVYIEQDKENVLLVESVDFKSTQKTKYEEWNEHTKTDKEEV